MLHYHIGNSFQLCKELYLYLSENCRYVEGCSHKELHIESLVISNLWDLMTEVDKSRLVTFLSSEIQLSKLILWVQVHLPGIYYTTLPLKEAAK